MTGERIVLAIMLVNTSIAVVAGVFFFWIFTFSWG